MKKIAIGIMAAVLIVGLMGCASIKEKLVNIDKDVIDTWVDKFKDIRDIIPARTPSEEVPEFEDEVPIDGTRGGQNCLLNFKVTHDLKARIEGGTIHFDQTLTAELNPVAGSAGNVIIIRKGSDGKWIAYAYDWIRKDSTSKPRHEIGDVPSGEQIGLCVASHIRQHWRNGNKRTKTVLVTVP